MQSRVDLTPLLYFRPLYPFMTPLLGFVQSVTDPLNRAVSFQYDLAGRVTKQILPDLREINFTYDANGNVASITPPGRPEHGFQYTAVDLESEYDPPAIGLPEHRTQFAYNIDKQLTTITRPDAKTVAFAYDTGGRVSSFTTPRGSTSFAYDNATGNETSITAPDLGTQSFTYDGSLLLSTTWAGGIAGSVSRTYDNDFRITSRSVNGGNTISFGYDNDSLLTSAGSQSLAYDAAGRLITVNRNGSLHESFTYDSNGNRTNNGAVYDNQDRLTSLDATSYSYTANGELLTKVNGADTTSYTYDVLGNLINVTLPSGNVIEYIVDGSNRRIGKKVDGVLEQGFLYKDQLNPVAELDGAGNVVSRFIYTSRANVPDYMVKGGNTYRIISDHLGSPQLIKGSAHSIFSWHEANVGDITSSRRLRKRVSRSPLLTVRCSFLPEILLQKKTIQRF